MSVMRFSKTFELEIAPLWPKELQGIPGTQIALGLKDLLEQDRWEQLINMTVVPLGLRWRLNPEMGLPRKSFSVWRRDRRLGDPYDIHLESPGLKHLGKGVYHVPAPPLYILVVQVYNNDPTLTQTLTVQAYDTANNPIQLQTVDVPPGSRPRVRFQHPFIGGFSCAGSSFRVLNVKGVTMKSFIERTEEWQLIENVGMPAKVGEIGGYESEPQGYPTRPLGPPDAALMRLKVAQQFYLPLLTTLPSGVNVPDWEIPEPMEAVQELRDGTPSLVQRIDEMFRKVDAGTVSTFRDYRTSVRMLGFRQPETPDTHTADATMNLPLLNTVLLNAATDSWFSLASGFGTTDFPEFLQESSEFIQPSSYFHVSHDYMVSAPFDFKFGPFEFRMEYCALSHKSAFPALKPEGLDAQVHSQNRPDIRDDEWSAEIALTWTKQNHLQVQGNAIAVAENVSSGTYLNPLRPARNANKPALFVPMKPGSRGDRLLYTRNRFIHHHAKLPFTGSKSLYYGIASMDSCGRWSEWNTIEHPLVPRVPESPRLNALALAPDKTRIVGNTVPHELSLEILWDWQDRSPKRFQLAAVFHRRRYLPDGTKDNGHIPPITYPTIFQTDNIAPVGALIDLTFPSDLPPGTPPVFNVVPTCPEPNMTIELLPQAMSNTGENVEGEIRRYRIKLRDLMLTFQPDEEWFFTVFIKASEWRNPLVMSDTSIPVLPGRPPHLTAYVPNPVSAPPPIFVPAAILWAPLPDALGISRYRLAFDHVPNATGGYAIYQASESKLRDIANLPLRSDPDLVARATELRDLVTPLENSVDAFARVNAKLIPPPAPGKQVEYEVEIPGTIDSIIVFAVSSVTREQESSSLSSPWLFIAVPRRAVPALPMLSITHRNGTARLSCDFPKAPKPSRVEILRSRFEYAARDIDTMGPPIHESTESEWEALDKEGSPAASTDQIHHYRFTFSDPTPPSWFPYLYRAVSIGSNDISNGYLPGRSPQSNLVQADNIPNTIPEIINATGEQDGPQTVRLQFNSDAPVTPTRYGGFELDVIPWDFVHNLFDEAIRTNILLSNARPQPPDGILSPGKLYYLPDDTSDRHIFRIPVSLTSEEYLLKVRLTDPMGRSAERIVRGKIVETAAPHLADMRTNRADKDLLIFFESTTSAVRPPSGRYRLDISFIRASGGGIQLLLRRDLHDVAVGDLQVLGTLPITTILREVISDPPVLSRYGVVIKGFYESFNNNAPSGRVRLRLRAPDGRVVTLESEV